MSKIKNSVRKELKVVTKNLNPDDEDEVDDGTHPQDIIIK
jgi:hypothetical protein